MSKAEAAFENSNASKRRTYNQILAAKRGKRESFDARENAAMSHVLRTLQEKNGWTQEEVGARIGVNQQNAGKILHGRQGFSRFTAMKLALMCGFDGPDALLRDLGAKAASGDAPKGWNERDIAVGAARRIGYPEAALDAVVGRYQTSEYANRKARWWMDRIVWWTNEMSEMEEPAPASAASAASVHVPVVENQQKQQKRARRAR